MSFENFSNPEGSPALEVIDAVFEELADEQKINLEVLKKIGNTYTVILQHLALPGFEGVPTLTEEELETFTNHAISRMRDAYPEKNWIEALSVSYLGDGEVEIEINPDKLEW